MPLLLADGPIFRAEQSCRNEKRARSAREHIVRDEISI